MKEKMKESLRSVGEKTAHVLAERKKKEFKKKLKKLAAKVCLIMLGCGCGYLLYVHRRVIRAAIKGEDMPKCPHWLPKRLKKRYGF